MGCKSSKVTDVNEKAAPILKPWSERKCRDVLWLLIFIAFWVGNVGVFIVGYQNGDASRLLYGVDAFGNQCGGKDSVCSGGKPCGKFITYPRVDKDFAQAVQNGVDLSNPAEVLDIPFYGLCVNSCPEGTQDHDADGQIRDIVCDYKTTDYMNLKFPTSTDEKRPDETILSIRGKNAFNECLNVKHSYGGSFGELLMPDTSLISGEDDPVECKKILAGCFKMYVKERSLFFRCVPETQENATCLVSPYLESIGEKAGTMKKDDKDVARPATNKHCGTCLDPVNDESGRPMDPGDKSCKARSVTSSVSVLEVTPNPVFEQVNSWTAQLTRWMGDISLASTWILLAGAGGAVIISAVWMVLLRYFAGVFVWTVIWALLLCLAVLSCQLLIYGKVIDTEALTEIFNVFSSANSTAGEAAAEEVIKSMDIFGEQDASTEKAYRISGYVMVGVTGVYLILVLSLSRKIRLAVQILKEATKVVAVMPMLMVMPLGTVAASLAIGVYWVYVSMLISSSGTIAPKELPGFEIAANLTSSRRLDEINVTDAAASVGSIIVNEFASSDLNTWLWVYNFFAFLWTNQLIQAVSACTIAGAVSSYYWASEFENEKASKMGRLPVWRAFLRTLRFHLGSLIFGSFIIAVVQLIRAALAYLDKQTQSLQKKNKVVKILMKVVQCCLWCFEKILKFVTKHAYIQIALKGSSFCTATKDGFFLLLNNLAKIGVLTAINNLIMLFAKLVIAVGSGGLCWVCVTTFLVDEDAPSTVLIPVIVAAMLAWFVGGLFMSVYGLTVDTILISFCEDEKHNDGSVNKPYYMSNALKRIAKKSNKVFKSQQAERKAVAEEDEEPVEAAAEEAPSKQLL